MVKIKSYKIRQEGLRGAAIGLPKVWLDDLKLKYGDKIDFYRDEENRLILMASKEGES